MVRRPAVAPRVPADRPTEYGAAHRRNGPARAGPAARRSTAPRTRSAARVVPVRRVQRLVEDREPVTEVLLGDRARRYAVGAVEVGHRPQPPLLAGGGEGVH